MTWAISGLLAVLAGCHDTLPNRARPRPQLDTGLPDQDANARTAPTRGNDAAVPTDSGSELDDASSTTVRDSGPSLGSGGPSDAAVEFKPLGLLAKRLELGDKRAHDITSFTAAGVPHLVVGNYYDGARSTHLTDSIVYSWDGNTFREAQSIPTQGALGVEAFAVEGEQYLVIANSYDGKTGAIDSIVLQWQGGRFERIQALATKAASQPEVFVMNNDTFLVMPSAWDNASNSIHVSTPVYRWRAGQFTPIQLLGSLGTTDSCHFQSGADHYLLVTSNYDGGDVGLDSAVLYRWNGSAFEDVQRIPTEMSYHCHTFKVRGTWYAAISHYATSPNFIARAVPIYQWDGVKFRLHQTLDVRGPRGIDSFRYGGENYLAVVAHDPSGPLGEAHLFKWHTGGFREHQRLGSPGAVDVHAFEIDGQPRLAIANYFSGSSGTNSSKVWW